MAAAAVAPYRNGKKLVPVALVTPSFLEVYRAYPRRDAKQRAALIWRELADEHPGGETALRAAILAWFATSLARAPYSNEHRYRPLLETVLAERRWEDDASAPDNAAPPPPRYTGPSLPRLE